MGYALKIGAVSLKILGVAKKLHKWYFFDLVIYFKGLKMKHKTRVRNHVFARAWSIARSKEGAWYGYFTVGELEPETDYSRPTVQKYINLLVEEGLLECIQYRGSTRIYRFCGVGA